MYSLVVPVFLNANSIDPLLQRLEALRESLPDELEVVFVVDGSPDRSFIKLQERLPRCVFRSQLLLLSRNFGSFAAIRAGMAEAKGRYIAVMAADLQEPADLVIQFFRTLADEPVDVVVGRRTARQDPMVARLASSAFWLLYRLFVQEEVPAGGVDVFACTAACRDQLMTLNESNSSLVGLLCWIGFRRKTVAYERLPRAHGKSAWTLRRKMRYLTDSVYAFSDLPIRLMTALGACGLIVSGAFGVVVLAMRIRGGIPVPGYTATLLTILFFGALNLFGLGIIGSYVWRAFENTKGRPATIVMWKGAFGEEGYDGSLRSSEGHL